MRRELRARSRVAAGQVTMLEYRILGSFEVVDNDRLLALGAPRQRALLALLLLNRGQPVTTDRLIDQLWEERPPATASKVIQGYVSQLRRVLGETALLTRGGGYMLTVEDEQVDAERFERFADEARRLLAYGDVEAARGQLVAALSLWRGEALSDFAYERFAQSEVARLEEARLAAIENRIEADLRLGAHHEVIGELEALGRSYPNRERLLGLLMLALYRSGRQADALDAFRRGRAALNDELGLEPGPELRMLEQQILEHDPVLEVAQTRSVAASRHSGGPRTGERLLVFGGLLLLVAAVFAALIVLTSSRSPSVRVGANSVAGIDVKTDRVTAAAPVGTAPDSITYGSGSLWVANVDDRTISRLSASTLQSQGTISLKQPATGLAATNSSIWAVTFNPTTDFDRVDEIDPHFNHVDRSLRVANLAWATGGAIAARSGAVWVAPYAGLLTRLGSVSSHVDQRVNPSAEVTELAVGAGAEWVSDNEADEVIRIDPTGLTIPIPVGHNPTGITAGGGSIWVADTGDDAVMKINPSTNASVDTIPVGHAPLGVTYGAGSVWVANSGDGTVSRINPRTDRVTQISVGGSPQAVVVAAGRAWVTVDAPEFPSGGARGDTLREVFNDTAFTGLDPAIADDLYSWQLLYATCAKLLNYPDKAGAAASRLVPEVARSMPVVTNAGRTYTFTIRKGFEFSPPSNEPVTAQTFKYTIERTLTPAMQSPERQLMSDVVGASAYMAGKAKHISGIVVRGDKLIIHLNAPEPDLPSRLAEPFYCAVPTDTPIDPAGINTIPSAGPYTVTSYSAGQAVVLARNPNYHGPRPRRFARIEVAMNVPTARGVAEVETGVADYDANGATDATQATSLAKKYGADSQAARQGHQQYFVDQLPELDYFALNTQRGPFRSRRLREAVNFAIDRRALARLGDPFIAVPEQPLSHYLPSGIPGYRDIEPYPPTPDVAKARELASGYQGTTVALYTCDYSPCEEQARIVTTDFAAIGLHVEVHAFGLGAMFSRYLIPGEPFDMGYVGWVADYPDPDDFLNLVNNREVTPAFRNANVKAQLAAAALLTGEKRILAYARLDRLITSKYAPFIAWGEQSAYSLFAQRIGCQVFSPYYLMDLAALCARGSAR